MSAREAIKRRQTQLPLPSASVAAAAAASSPASSDINANGASGTMSERPSAPGSASSRTLGNQKSSMGNLLVAVKTPSEIEMEILDEYVKRLELLPLPVELLKRGLSEIGSAPDKLKSVYRKLSLPNSDMKDIHTIGEYPFLYNIDLRGNQIKDLSPLSSLPYLVQIDFSNNKLTSRGRSIDFKGTHNLQDVNLGKNEIEEIDDLAKNHPYLKNLCLDDNIVNDLSPLSRCRYLKVLNIAGNKIESLEPLANLPLKSLDASRNRIVSLKGVEKLLKLQELHIEHNAVQELSLLANHPSLTTLSASHNQFEDLEQFITLAVVPLLRYLALSTGNNQLTSSEASKEVWDAKGDFPLHSNARFPPSFRLYAIHILQGLDVFDGITISPEERVSARNHYAPPSVVSLAIHHVNNQKLAAKEYAHIKAVDLLRAKRLCPVVIFGPSGVGKRTLTRRLLKEFPHIYGHVISHTSRAPRPGEEHGVHYMFTGRQELEKMNAQGKFLEYVTLFGNVYGTSIESIDSVTELGKVCLLDLEIEGVAALKKAQTLRAAHYILISSPNIIVLRERLAQRQKLSTSDPEIEMWVEKAKSGVWKEGDYDLEVVNDDLEVAYEKLKLYCLGLYWNSFEED